MSEGQNGANGAPTPPAPIRRTDDRGRPLPLTEEERAANVRRWDETVAAMDAIRDETDTDEIWDEILRNLGVDPATGRGLGS